MNIFRRRAFDFVVCALIALPAAIMYGVLSAFWPKDSGAWASWFQAIGSVFGIYLAVAVAGVQTANTAADRREDRQASRVRDLNAKYEHEIFIRSMLWDAYTLLSETASDIAPKKEADARMYDVTHLIHAAETLSTALVSSRNSHANSYVIDARRSMLDAINVFKNPRSDQDTYQRISDAAKEVFRAEQRIHAISSETFYELLDEIRGMSAKERLEKAIKHANDLTRSESPQDPFER